ncbi:MAG: GNAT family N-acetyltransferase [Acidobacteriota bacterium]|nr:GNAT family N-acetyltransferase [Acidobacteriota bacterium]
MSTISIRRATNEDLTGIIRLLADDELGAKREQFEIPLPACYRDAFTAIDTDPNQELMVADCDGRVVGTFQLSFLPNLTYRGGWRALVEAVRVDSSMRGEGLGARLIEHAVERARERGCRMIQLTTDKTRQEAKRFYEKLGFTATHEGMKLWFTGSRTGE